MACWEIFPRRWLITTKVRPDGEVKFLVNLWGSMAFHSITGGHDEFPGHKKPGSDPRDMMSSLARPTALIQTRQRVWSISCSLVALFQWLNYGLW